MGADATPAAGSDASDALFNFPCDFPIKVMGKTDPLFEPTIADVIQRFDDQFDSSTIESKLSSKGQYTGLTCTVRAVSRAHLDEIYRALTAHPMVKYVM